MSQTEETKKLEERVLVDENCSEEQALAVNEEAKESKLKKVGKIALKVAAFGGVGFLGFLLGSKVGKKNKEETESDYEIVDDVTDIQ